jgi:hypothetical protein
MANYDEKDIKIAQLEEQVKQLKDANQYFKELTEKLLKNLLNEVE